MTPEKITETFAISKVDYNKMAEEIYEYFSCDYCDDKSHKENFEALVNAYYDTVIRVLDKTIHRISILQKENSNKFSELYNAKLRIDKMIDNYFEVYIADYSYHNVAFLSDEKEKMIDDNKKLFFNVLCEKIYEFNNDENIVFIISDKAKLEQNVKNRKQCLHNDLPDDEYYKIVASDEVVKQSENKISCYDKAINAFLFNKNFEESFENHINKEDEEIYRKVYIKRRIHQFTFKKEEMYQYFIRSYLTFDENTSLVKEIYQDIGHFVPTHGGNMKKLFYAYFDLCVYEFNKNFILLCSATEENPNKSIIVKNARANADKISKALHDVYFYYTNNYRSDEKASDLVYDVFDKNVSNFDACFKHKIQLFFPEIKLLYGKIDELYTLIERDDNHISFFNRKPNPHNDAIYAEINAINKSIEDFIKGLA